jgi:major membrane immunogen (membrane-anchored lipoprotein)
MKKYILSIIPLLMAAILLGGCGKADIQGNWKKEEAAGIDKGYDSDEYNFFKNGTFDYNNDGLALDKGKYEVKGDTVKLKGEHNTYTVKIKDGKQFKYKGKVYKKQKD